MIRIVLSLVFFGISLTSTPVLVQAGGAGPVDVEIKTTRDLKQFMFKFGGIVLGLEVLRVKDKTPDWRAVNLSLKEMNETLGAMQKADKGNAYKSYTDQLATQMAEIKKLSQKKSPQIFDAIDKLIDSCFQCHAAHRPADFLRPKDNRQLSQESK